MDAEIENVRGVPMSEILELLQDIGISALKLKSLSPEDKEHLLLIASAAIADHKMRQ